ncbi:MAG TPA: alkaline phosphatase family protein [Acidimicrobiia bacterium]|nr:alkaline phosphatase family protein [Acidimicrobiia bacterium]
MLKCIQWVDRSVIRCKLWAVEATRECKKWVTQASQECVEWAQQTSQECTEWRDEGENQCKGWEKRTEEKCCDWQPCKFFCSVIVTIVTWVCIGWYWVANWVCQAWTTVVKWVCKAWEWLVKVICTVFFWLLRVVCVVWGWVIRTICWIVDRIRCFFQDLIVDIGRLLGGEKPEPRRVEHVFVLMLENRSYDHMLGFAALRGTDAITGATVAADGADPATHTNTDPADGQVVPVFTPAPFKIEGTMDEDPGHEFEHVVKQMAGAGAVYDPALGYPNPDMSGFIATHRERGSVDPKSIMACFDPEQVRVITTLAREFAVCDRWFSSMPGPTWPNRFFAAAASSAGLDDSPETLELVINTALDGYRFYNGTIYDLLDAKCLPWKVYHGDELPVSFALAGMTVNRIADRFDDMDDFATDVADEGYDAVFTFIEPHYGNILPGTPEDYTCGTSQHPLDDVTRGERLIKEVYESIRNSPHWERSVLIITWDEHGGFYDHVSPPAAVAPGDPPGDPDNNTHGFDFTQLGARVPAVVVSPLIERGMIDHTQYDHASIPATVERLFGLTSMTNRDAQASDVLHLLSRETPRDDAPPVLPDPAVSGWRCESDPQVEATGEELRGEPVRFEELDPPLRQAVNLAARARIGSLRQWDAHGRLQVLDEMKAIQSEMDARGFVLAGRETIRRWRAQRGETSHRGYTRLVKIEQER